MKNLLKALHAVAAEVKDPVKQSKNPAFKSKYADINAVLEVLREPLQTHGLVITQTYGTPDTARTTLITTVWHVESGESLSSEMELKPIQNTPQALGSAATYGRRYSLSALFGLGSVDDDANAASGNDTPVVGPAAPIDDQLYVQATKALAGAKTAADVDRVLGLVASLPAGKKAEVQKLAVETKKRLGG